MFYLKTPALELLDGNNEGLTSATDGPDSAFVDTPEAAFSDLQHSVEPVSGFPKLIVREDSQRVLLLLVQLRYALWSRGQRTQRLSGPVWNPRGPGPVSPLELRCRFCLLLRL